jgi:PAS domain S-box-containing protein
VKQIKSELSLVIKLIRPILKKRCMNKPKQPSVGKQVFFTFGMLCVILLIIGGLYFFSLQSIGDSIQQRSLVLDKLALIDDAAQFARRMQLSVFRQILASDPGEIKKIDQSTHDYERTNAMELADYQKFADTENEKQLYARIMQRQKAYWEQTQRVLAFGLNNQDAEATKLMSSTQIPAFDEFINAIKALIKYEKTDADETARATTRFISEIKIFGNVLVGATILIVIGTGLAVMGIGHRLKNDNRLLQNEVTERRRIETELNHEREFLRTLMANLPDKIYFKDIQSRFVKNSAAHARQFGLASPDELTGKTDFDFFAESHARPAFEDEQEIIRTGRPVMDKEEREESKDGQITWAASTKIPWLDAAGKIIGIMGVSRDITARKKLEAQLFQSRKMETVGKLAGGIAHEFNSILTAIIGQSELLLEDLPPGSQLTESVTEIIKAANRAATLTRQLLAYGRKQFLQLEILDLNQLISGMADMLHKLLGGNVDAKIVPAVDLHAVQADAGQIEQVIMNMVVNARDAMPNGGKLTLETANVSFDAESIRRYPELKSGGYVMLAITDTGAGMSEEVRERLFEPFFSTKGVGQGTGLGLSTCYGIIKQSGGHISVYSELGRGTTFKIYLPQIEPQTKIPVQHIDSPDLPRGTETILLVDDDPALREMAATLLRRLGYTVLTAANGIEALNLQQRDTGHIDLLFTDVVMPQMSGQELADRVRALYPKTWILFTSAYTENAIVHQGVLDKGVVLLQKPFTLSALANKLREVLDQEKPPEN